MAKASGFKYLTEEDVQRYLPYVGSRSKVKKLYDKPEYASAGADAEEKITYITYLGKQYTEAELAKRLTKLATSKVWTRAKVSDLQIKLGLEPTGRYDLTTAAAHVEYFRLQTQFDRKIAQNWLLSNAEAYRRRKAEEAKASISYLPNLRDPSHPIAMSSEQAAIENAIRQGRNERKAIQEDMFRTWKDISGVTASEANVNWATEKVLQGWGYDDFYFWMKDRPEMKKMYPGMPNGMLPSEYTDVARSLNLKYMQTAGRPLKRHEIANLIRGGDFPEDDFFLGQPAIRDEEIR